MKTYIVTVSGSDTSGPFDFYFGDRPTAFRNREDAEALLDDLASDAVFGPDGDQRLDEVGAHYAIRAVDSKREVERDLPGHLDHYISLE